uniref:Uncharacterized protein n=1 Tax=Macrostomum lignano TaxID=282301 RepID=A0A1I8FCK9_9PLAT
MEYYYSGRVDASLAWPVRKLQPSRPVFDTTSLFESL